MNETNKFLLLKAVATQGPVSRIELSRMTGLSKMTVTTLVNEYIENGIIRECGTVTTQAGRKPRLLEAVPHSLLTLGIDIGRDFIAVGIINLCGDVQLFEHAPMTRISSGEALASTVLQLCDNIMRRANTQNVWGIGISCMGPLDIAAGAIVNPPDFNNIKNVPIVDILKQRYELPVYLENDMCISALAELYFGKGRDYNRFAYVGVSAGVGGGLVIDRRLYRGTKGFAAVIGHTLVEPEGLQCKCGNRGCLEAYSSVRATVRWAVDNGASDDLTWSMLLDNARKGDETCLAALDRMNKYLEIALINLVNIVDVQCVFLGGDIWYGAEFFVDRLTNALRGKVFGPDIGPKIEVRMSQFSANAPFIGTAALVMENNLQSII